VNAAEIAAVILCRLEGSDRRIDGGMKMGCAFPKREAPF